MSDRVQTIPMGMALSYLIEGDRGMVLVDAGSPGQEERVLERVHGTDLALIFITHAHMDHYGSAAALRRATGAPIAIHRADGAAMASAETPLGSVRGRGRLVRALMPLIEWVMRPEPTPADVLLDDGDVLGEYGIDGEVLHTPGHTPGSTSLLIGGELAFVGDLLSNTGHPHVQRYFADDWTCLSESFARLKACQPRLVYTGHGRGAIEGQTLGRLSFE